VKGTSSSKGQITDFLIAAHAQTDADALAGIDRG
jgi:hypothetical protein